MPDDSIYLPMHVGKAGKASIGYQGDDTGDNISERNDCYCELTGLYWAWKNLKADYKGLVHYRRHFTRGNPWLFKRHSVYGRDDFEKMLKKSDILVPDLRRYYIETNLSHYVHAHHKRDVMMLRKVLEERQPGALSCFDRVMRRNGAHMFNMMVMRDTFFDAYAAWLFDLLFELEARIDISGYDNYQRRVFGYIGELLLDVWLEIGGFPFTEINVAFMEHQNWIKKGGMFLLRKIKGMSHCPC